jgi:hypothetical protein
MKHEKGSDEKRNVVVKPGVNVFWNIACNG